MFRDNDTWTVEGRILNQRVVFTADPENIKAILATQFADYGKGEPFHKEWQAFLGDSIFTTDGQQWHTSRQLIRPQFTRDRVSDLHCFESHIQTFFRAMANGGPLNGENQPVDMASGDGKIFDISDLFFRYTLDVTTEFLLGTDVKTLTYASSHLVSYYHPVLTNDQGPLNKTSPRPSTRSSACKTSSHAPLSSATLSPRPASGPA
jgi:cytochrome P450